ncbi:unnamed protein product [Strongylus vulgaris]|uniref:Uncharacterized protein n=1 Tax=Strongylus vulgaris TaxID=40348 RepID=A0A3P7IRG8_STRVU|nr:unnamed protein product [Strongylus vulgaris]
MQNTGSLNICRKEYYARISILAVQHERPLNGKERWQSTVEITTPSDGKIVRSTLKSNSQQCQDKLKSDFSISRLVAPSNENSLVALIRWWSSSPPASSLDVDDRKILFCNSWHFIFFLSKISQLSGADHESASKG